MLYVAGEEMIDKALIIDQIEKLINGEIDHCIPEHNSDANAVENTLENVVARLVNTFKKYREGEAGISDYVSTLRNFMLSFQTELRVDDHGILDNNHFGIRFNPSSQKYYATYEIPDDVRHKSFVENAFVTVGSTAPETRSPYCLLTNR